jgi:hypothetical protein
MTFDLVPPADFPPARWQDPRPAQDRPQALHERAYLPRALILHPINRPRQPAPLVHSVTAWSMTSRTTSGRHTQAAYTPPSL